MMLATMAELGVATLRTEVSAAYVDVLCTCLLSSSLAPTCAKTVITYKTIAMGRNADAAVFKNASLVET